MDCKRRKHRPRPKTALIAQAAQRAMVRREYAQQLATVLSHFTCAHVSNASTKATSTHEAC